MTGSSRVAASAAAAPTSNDMYVVKLNLRPNQESGLVFVGNPPQLKSYDPSLVKLPPGQPSIANYYFDALEVPGLEIFHVSSEVQANQFLIEFQDGARCLTLSSHPPSGYTFHEMDCMYKHDLPANQALGLDFQGSPPKICKVEETSPLFQKGAKEGQYVESILLPDRPDFTTMSPGFDGVGVRKRLDDTNHLQGRKLVLKDLTKEGIRQAKKLDDDKNHSTEKAAAESGTWNPCCCM